MGHEEQQKQAINENATNEPRAINGECHRQTVGDHTKRRSNNPRFMPSSSIHVNQHACPILKNTWKEAPTFTFSSVGDGKNIFVLLRRQIRVIDVVDIHFFGVCGFITRVTQRLRIDTAHVMLHRAQIVKTLQLNRILGTRWNQMLPSFRQSQTARR